MQEIWKSLKGVVEYGDNYEISNLGRVRSIDYIDNRGYNRKGKIMSPSNHTKGYKIIPLTLRAKKKTYKVHRLVALAFIPNLENKPEVNHKDGDKTNNNVDNLEWMTGVENIQHSHDNNLHGGDKLYNEDKEWIRKNHKPYNREFSMPSLAKKFDVSSQTIYFVINGRKSRSKGR